MSEAPGEEAAIAASERAFRRLVALVVDDSAVQRRVMRLMLSHWNFEVLEAADGTEALATCRRRPVDFLICDWAMPGLTGPALCRALRALPLAQYVYVILLTARSDRGAVAEGLEAGADDFLSKPPDAGELHARLRAGERILSMQEDLVDKNRRITEAFDRLSALYEATERDLRSAARLQRALIPPRQGHCGPVGVGALWQPAGHVGGDLVGVAQVSRTRLAVHAVDVSGHGVPSALMTARLAHLFAPGHPDESPAIRRMASGARVPADPAALAAELNRRLQDEADSGQYFTMLFADMDLWTGLVRFCQAGHPPPAVLRRDGTVEFHGEGGAPVGLIADTEWETETIRLHAGDRLVLMSDGVTECEDPAGEAFEAAALARVLAATRHLTEGGQAEALLAAMQEFSGTARFADDVSALVLTMP